MGGMGWGYGGGGLGPWLVYLRQQWWAPAPGHASPTAASWCSCPPPPLQVTGNVSGKTSFLVVGSHAGRTKVFNAKEKEVGACCC